MIRWVSWVLCLILSLASPAGAAVLQVAVAQSEDAEDASDSGSVELAPELLAQVPARALPLRRDHHVTRRLPVRVRGDDPSHARYTRPVEAHVVKERRRVLLPRRAVAPSSSHDPDDESARA